MKFNVKIQPSEICFESENNLLDDALSQNVSLEHSCKSGACGACEAQIVSGTVENLQGELVDSGTILTCCSKPKSDLTLIANYYPELADLKPQTVPCKVANFSFVCDDIVVVRFRFPPTVNFNYLPGQYVDLSFNGVKRSYSIANMKDDSNEVELHIRRAPNGQMSTLLFSGLKDNQLMRMEGPKGTFFIRKGDKPLIFIATGTGIAPVKAMVEALVHVADKRTISVYWGMRDKNGLYDTGLDEIANKYPHIQFSPVLSREENWDGHKGYVQQAVMNDFTSLESVDVYACGSLDMIQSAKALFSSNGLPKNSFYSDAFTPAK